MARGRFHPKQSRGALVGSCTLLGLAVLSVVATVYWETSPPPPHWLWRSVASTRDLVVVDGGRVVPVLYSRSCGGRSHSLRAVGMDAPGYPYRPVPCRPCQRPREEWARSLPLTEAQGLLTRTGFESARLGVTRVSGWSAVPSNHYQIRRQDDRMELKGRGWGTASAFANEAPGG